MAGTYFVRTRKQRNYTTMDNTFLRDDRLSWKAKGLFAYLLSLPEDWKIYTSEIINHSTDGETATRTAIKELTELGYIEQARLKDENGKYSSYQYTIIENPSIYATSQKIEKMQDSDFQDVENQDVENLNGENQVLLNTNSTKYLNKQNTDKRLEQNLFPVTKTKKESKAKDIVTMKAMINAFTESEDLRDKLTEYFSLRLKKGLQPNQWKIILDDLKTFTKGHIDLAVEKVNGAIAGGYLQIIPPWEKNRQQAFSKPSFDNTAGREVKSAKEEKEILATDENGNLIKF